MFLRSRGSRGYDRWYRLRFALFIVGTGCVLAGIRAERRWAVWVGMGVLGFAVVVGLVTRPRRGDQPPDGDATEGPGD